MELLRDRDFQDLLENYPRPSRTFLIDYSTLDEVSSTWMVRDSAGQEYKPADYLTLFSRFVQENPEKIEAIEILLDRPQEWSTDALAELKQKLTATPQRFTLENLQRAHQVHYQKALVDVISMVKHAAREGEELLTAEERIDRAFQMIMDGKTFTEEQEAWLDRIRAHLIQNLSINEEDFEIIPVFADHGGWGRANRVFDNRLSRLLQELNEAIAA